MIDWIKFFPIKLRDGISTEIKGPDFKSARPISLLACGNKIELKAPRHRSTVNDSPIYVQKSEGTETGFREFNQRLVANKNWQQCVLLIRSWTYWKACFAGSCGELYISSAIIKRTDNKKFADISFFHPKSFEYIISNYLTTRFGFKENPNYQAPINWNTNYHLPVFSASFDVKGSNEKSFFVFPISDSHFIELEFNYVGYNENMLKNMRTLAQQIINSVTLTLSNENQAAWDKVKGECPDMSLAKTFAPLKWPVKPEDIE